MGSPTTHTYKHLSFSLNVFVSCSLWCSCLPSCPYLLQLMVLLFAELSLSLAAYGALFAELHPYLLQLMVLLFAELSLSHAAYGAPVCRVILISCSLWCSCLQSYPYLLQLMVLLFAELSLSLAAYGAPVCRAVLISCSLWCSCLQSCHYLLQLMVLLFAELSYLLQLMVLLFAELLFQWSAGRGSVALIILHCHVRIKNGGGSDLQRPVLQDFLF